MKPNETDAQFIQRSLSGERRAFTLLCDRHRQRVFAIAFNALRNADDAQDITQETFVYVFQKLPELRDPKRFSGWLRTLVLSLCADYRRRRGTRALGEPITVLNESREETQSLDGMMIAQAIAHLSETHRTTFLLYYTGGWSLEEVSDLMTVPINTVRSRLMTAKRLLKTDLAALIEQKPISSLKRNRMTAPTIQSRFDLTEAQRTLLSRTFPNAEILSVQSDPEPWMPFKKRIQFRIKEENKAIQEKTVDLRDDLTPERIELYQVLEQLGIPSPRPLSEAAPDGKGGFSVLAEIPRGENLSVWALGGTPHRLHLAADCALKAIDRLQSVTDALMSDPVSANLPRKTLVEEAATLTDAALWEADLWLNTPESKVAEWRQNDWFRTTAAEIQKRVRAIQTPLAFTHYLHFFPNFLRITPGSSPADTPLSGLTDLRFGENKLAECVAPDGYFGDPYLGLAMVWVYDCYPFVHTGFVEQFLWRRGVTRREFAPRLALKALQTLARECPLERPDENGYWDALKGYVETSLAWK